MAADPTATPPDPDAGPLGRALDRACRSLALAGGLVLTALALTTVTSIVGRALFSAPIPGDFELVEIGTAVAVFAFLPWCQLRRGNVIVDLFTMRLGATWRGVLDAAGAAIYAAIALLLAWRSWQGGSDMKLYGEQTMVLALPVWWSFVAIVPSLALLSLVAAYTAWRHLAEVPR